MIDHYEWHDYWLYVSVVMGGTVYYYILKGVSQEQFVEHVYRTGNNRPFHITTFVKISEETADMIEAAAARREGTLLFVLED